MKKFPLVFAVFAILSACSAQAPQVRKISFVSKKATEATLSYSFEVEMISKTKPTSAEAREKVEAQILHMFGPMERADAMAAPKEDHNDKKNGNYVKLTGIKKLEDVKDGWRISYDYRGTIVLENGPRTRYDFPLPINPDFIYQQAMGRTHNPCTDEHYQSEGDFWYFWSPADWGNKEYPDCKLQSNENGRIEAGEHYEVVKGTVERLEKDRTTYPEYDRLANNAGVIDFHMMYGMDDTTNSVNPYESKDINAETYRATVNDLTEKLGFKVRRWSKAEIAKVAKELESKVFVEEATKDYPDGVKVRVRIFFGQTGIDEKSAGFHYFLRDALKNSSVMVYNGHSGLGGHLDLKDIAEARGFRMQPNKNRYQIYFFNSCTSYTYYNTKYFHTKAKKRDRRTDSSSTKNLDIMANGLSTAFDSMHNSDMALVKAVDKWAATGKWVSYQKMAREIDSDNLFTVNGDEDNPTEPR